MVHSIHKISSGKQVAVLINTSNGLDKGLLQGIKQFTQQHHHWSVYVCDLQSDLSWLSHWKGSGIIARIGNEQLAVRVAELGLPTVDLASADFLQEVPYVLSIDVITAQMAADHLLELNFQTLATFSDARHEHSDGLRHHFSSYLQTMGRACESFSSTYNGKSEMEKKIGITRWLGNMPKPIGLFACSQTELLLETCQFAGYSIPEEVTVIALDQEQFLCEMLDPQLSTVIYNPSKAGYRAALLLEQMMSQQEANDPEADEDTGRSQVEAAARKDKIVAEALDFIRSNACDGITVLDVLNEVPLSRRVLEHRFRKALGKTLHEEIISARLKCVKKLLSETNLTLNLIADKAGFKHTEYLSVAFKREVGISPSQYRKLKKRTKVTVNYG